MPTVRVRPVLVTAWATLAMLAAAACTARRPQPSGSSRAATLIAGATLVDGTGGAPRRASVRVVGDRIVAVGDLEPEPSDRVVDGRGLVLAPGFIDTHSHADVHFASHRDALAAVSQGITTVIVGQDGFSADTLATFFTGFEARPAAVNVASYVGHNTVRGTVMGRDYKRRATAAEVERMRALVAQGMDQGALGLSTGLEYDPGIYSTREEVLALARVAARFSGGRYISHLRSEDRTFWAAVDEILTIGREAKLPVQISHTKLAMRSLWGRSDSLVHVLDRARAAGIDVTADVYPYAYWQSTLRVLFPERNFSDTAAARFALAELAAPEGLLLSGFAPDSSYVGKTVADIARLRGTGAAATLLALIHDAEALERDSVRLRALVPPGGETESVIGTSMDERDIEGILRWPYANVCTDGTLDDRHPRGAGSFPRVLGRYVRERNVLTWPEAIRKMTSLAAHNVGLRGRGTVAPRQHADLVLLDTATVIDRATLTDPHALSAGIMSVWVNGELVYQDGRATGRFPGRAIRRGTE